MSKDKWIYYVQVETRVVGKVNTDAFEAAMVDMGFRRCSYAEYLKWRKRLRERDKQIHIEGQVKNG